MAAIKITLKQTGSLRGIQPVTFTAGISNQLLTQGLLPLDGWYLAQNTDEPKASSDTVRSLAAITDTIVATGADQHEFY